MAPIGYFISRCPFCSSYVHTPIQQPLRICLQYQRIFRINPLNAQYVRDEKNAIARVKYYRTDKHDEEFLTAVEQSRAQVAELMPSRIEEKEDVQDNREDDSVLPSQRRLLDTLLREHAGTSPINLQLLEKECKRAGIPWLWASQQIEALVRGGRLVCPKPWQVQLVAANPPQTELASEHSPTTLAQRLGEIIREAKTPITIASLMTKLELEKAATAKVEEALEQLMIRGFIFRTSKGNYRWIGD